MGKKPFVCTEGKISELINESFFDFFWMDGSRDIPLLSESGFLFQVVPNVEQGAIALPQRLFASAISGCVNNDHWLKAVAMAAVICLLFET